MKLVDLNVLLYATDTRTSHHIEAKRWLDQAMSSSETVAIPTAVLVGFVRLTTNGRIMQSPLSVSQSCDIVRTWLDRVNVTMPQPTPRHYDLVEELVEATGTGGNIVSDAHLAVLAIEHGADLCSFDSDFSRFPGLSWFTPPT